MVAHQRLEPQNQQPVSRNYGAKQRRSVADQSGHSARVYTEVVQHVENTKGGVPQEQHDDSKHDDLTQPVLCEPHHVLILHQIRRYHECQRHSDSRDENQRHANQRRKHAACAEQ